MHVVAPEKASTCRSEGAQGDWIEKKEKVYDYVIACGSLKGKISKMKVAEECESRPHKAVSFLVESEQEMQEWNEQKLPKMLPGNSGGRLPGRTVERGESGMKSHKKWLRASRRRCSGWHHILSYLVTLSLPKSFLREVPSIRQPLLSNLFSLRLLCCVGGLFASLEKTCACGMNLTCTCIVCSVH